MGQQEIIDFLEQNPHREFTRKELEKIFGVSNSHISRSIRPLIKYKEIKIRRVHKKNCDNYRQKEYYSVKC